MLMVSQLWNQAYSAEYHTQVAKECSHHFDEFREAGIQNGVVSTIRSDHILWINESSSCG